MSPDEFKQILTLIESAKGDAVSVAYLLIGKEIVFDLIGYAIGGTALCLGYRLAKGILVSVTGLSDIRQVLNASFPLLDREWAEALRLLRIGVAKDKADAEA